MTHGELETILLQSGWTQRQPSDGATVRVYKYAHYRNKFSRQQQAADLPTTEMLIRFVVVDPRVTDTAWYGHSVYQDLSLPNDVDVIADLATSWTKASVATVDNDDLA